MDVDGFWQLIDESRHAAGGDARKQSELLAEMLARTNIETIEEFDDILHELWNEAYVAELWEAAYVIDCGCSDDGFASYREWLIARGKEAYRKALADPQTLEEIVEVGSRNVYPTLLGVTDHAYEQLTGHERPLIPGSRPTPQLKGALHEERIRLERFPRLKEKYWDWWLQHYSVA